MITLFLPFTFVTTFVALPLGGFGVTAIGSLHNFAWRLRFFLPQSSSAITDIGQAVALAGEAITLAFGCLNA